MIVILSTSASPAATKFAISVLLNQMKNSSKQKKNSLMQSNAWSAANYAIVLLVKTRKNQNKAPIMPLFPKMCKVVAFKTKIKHKRKRMITFNRAPRA